MIKLPAGTSPADGLVRVTTWPGRVCLPRTVNPSLMSSRRALMKVIPTTSGTGTRDGGLEAGALAEEAEALAVGRPARDAVGLPGTGAAGELAGEGWATERAVAGASAAVERCGPAAGPALDADLAAWPVAEGVVTVPLAASGRPLGLPLSRHAVTEPASSATSSAATARAARPVRPERAVTDRAVSGRVTPTVSGSSPGAPVSGPGSVGRTELPQVPPRRQARRGDGGLRA